MQTMINMVDRMTVELDGLAEARGVERCARIVELVQQLTALKRMLRDAANESEAESEAVK